MDFTMIAPCGINCGTCLAFLRDKNTCDGCRADNEHKRNSCIKCSIWLCESLGKTESQLCNECPKFPCSRIKHIDKRYRTKYHLSLIGNLREINREGLAKFLVSENEKWHCSNCGGTICVHRGYCLNCHENREMKFKLQRSNKPYQSLT